MKQSRKTYIKNILFPCLLFSAVTGIFTGGLIFLFKLLSGLVMDYSTQIYQFVREKPTTLPFLLLGAALLGLCSGLILHFAKNCRGGGIPTSVAILRGLMDFNWIKSILLLFPSALITFLGGIPLGNEGPSVQMGTAVGRGTVRLFAKKNRAWDRYIMTGGACGGFAAATGAPLSGIFFAFEEAHRRFSPMLFMTASVTAACSAVTMHLLCRIGGISPYLFDLTALPSLPLRHLWVSLVIGLLCGAMAVLFTKSYAAVAGFLNKHLSGLPFVFKTVLIFLLVALCGFASGGLVGSGHDIIHTLIEGHGVWYLMLLCLGVRGLFLILSNHTGITGGLFVPTLTFGALIGALFSTAAVKLGLLSEAYYVVPVIIGMTAFSAASSRTPITSITFALEALAGLSNMLPIVIGAALSFTVIETWGVISLNDTVINQKVADEHRDKTPLIVDARVTVTEGSFAESKEVRDILWPPTCTVLSIKKPNNAHSSHHAGVITPGDVLHIHYQTYDPEATADAIEAIVGVQAKNKSKTQAVNEKKQIVPEI